MSMKLAIYWASPFVPAIATLIILPVKDGKREEVDVDQNIACLIQHTSVAWWDYAEPAMPGALMVESGWGLPWLIQAAHLRWGRDSVHLISMTAERLELDPEII